MEGAARVFPGDFSGSTLSVPADEAGSPAWVVTPGGAWCRSLYLCGALTEVVEITDVLHCRVADPTGAFDIVSGGRRAAITEQIRAIPVPSFIAVTGTAQLSPQERQRCGLGPTRVYSGDRPGRPRPLDHGHR